MALVDANYFISYIDVGCQGHISDGSVFRNSSLYKKLEQNELNLPIDEPLPTKTEIMPYVFVGDDAFTLGKHMMKPYSSVYEKGNSKRIFNTLTTVGVTGDTQTVFIVRRWVAHVPPVLFFI